MSQLPNGSLNYFDGTVTTSKQLDDTNQYHDLRHTLAQEMNPPRSGKEVIVLSLTVIG